MTTRPGSGPPQNCCNPGRATARALPPTPRLARWPCCWPNYGSFPMTTSNDLSVVTWKIAVVLIVLFSRKARRSPSEFAEFAFTDSDGQPLRQAAIHRELQDFLAAHSRALI